ncbi:allantoin permease [Carnobacterium maltaromaticum]|uniref:allantoin permease n=1 Tax=Carnobacterium maltaromaticum TaxID=2751 RepID=UPI0010719E9C|nr:putative allantoin permease [Carnobacterium maltaromaticum]MDT1946285.1 putative allantoin permease [Carnobacterium maltaromaticum]MDT1999862.1 putative allantoin permease [Carnobacterium maltaromaticum]TFJ32466.1 allantoin permease [Carnobacterium maltaromaticum]TFJ35816.1 allantoin permease [Carnobacterium maltaromaticum]TFJ39635.1 allantoin permease [Carnobacterium maltaromaticum]
MAEKDVFAHEADIEKYKERGYNDDLLPKTKDRRNMNAKNYFTLWMGSVHNIPNYTAVGGFLFLGLSPINVILALIISSMAVAAFMVYNGRTGSKYGIPFAMHLRSTYGDLGAKLPGFLRGCVAAIAWFGLQNYAGSLALLILIGKIWPSFLTLGGDFNFFGLSLPGLIAFTIFWAANLLIGIGGGGALNKFTAILNPLIYVVFGGMAIWAIKVGGGIGPILAFTPSGADVQNNAPLFVYLIIITSVLSVWAAPGASVSDFTQNATSTRAQTIGQTASFLVAYIIFAFSSVAILIGGSIHYGVQEWNVLEIVEKWDSLPAICLAMLVFLLTTISTNATGNIIPAAYQLSALFPKTINYKKGVIIASVISYLIMPWKLMENANSIFAFLNIIGAVLGPVAGVMLAHFYFVKKQKIDLNALYMDTKADNSQNPYRGINKGAYVATIVALLVSISGQFIPALQVISSLSWLIGFGLAFILYLVLKKFIPEKV